MRLVLARLNERAPGYFVARPRCARWLGAEEDAEGSDRRNCTTLAPPSLRWTCSLEAEERSTFSQQGEDGILRALLRRFGLLSRPNSAEEPRLFYVEIGAEDGSECNTRFLREDAKLQADWQGFMMDSGKEDQSRQLYSC